MDQKIIKLRDWGCDIESAMERMLEDEDFYLECLNTIPKDNNFQELAQALESQNASAAFDCAHALKGILANLGLTPMYQKVVEIVEPLRAGKCENLLDKMNELEAMRSKLSEILQ